METFMTSPQKGEGGRGKGRLNWSGGGTDRWWHVRQRLNALSVDERAEPEFKVHERPDGVACVDGSVPMRIEKALHRGGVDETSLARAAIQQHVANNRLPPIARPLGKRDREAHLSS